MANPPLITPEGAHPCGRGAGPVRSRRWRFRLRKLLFYGFLAYMGIILLLQEINGFRLHRELTALKREVRAAHEHKAELQRQIEVMKTDAYIEQVARDQLGLTRPGEITFLPVEPGAAPRTPPPNTDAPAQAQ